MRRTSELIAGLLLAGCAGAQEVKAPAPEPPDPRDAVVKVTINGQDPDWGAPWTKKRPWVRRINGLVVPGRRILVHARRLAHATLVEVEKLGESRRYPAEVTRVDYEVPLAILEVRDDRFWSGLRPLPLADAVPTEGAVQLGRWLSSGQFEEAQGTIKQLHVDDHFPARTQLLTLEVSSPIQASGWGEIVLRDGEVVGITTSSDDDLLPALGAPVLRDFLAQVDGPEYRGFARHGFFWQNLSNPATRAHLGLGPRDGGVRVREVLPHGSAAGALEPGDVVLEIDGHRINEKGKFDHPRYGKLFFGVLFTLGKRPGDTLPITVLRAGARREVQARLRRMAPEEEVVPTYQYDRPPEFEVVGGLVFQPLTLDYLRRWRSWWTNGPSRLLVAYDRRGAWPTDPGRDRIIVLSRVLPDPVNLGYHDFAVLIVDRVNGRLVRSLTDLRGALADPKDGFHVVDFLAGSHQQRLVVDAEAAAAAEARILQRYGIGP